MNAHFLDRKAIELGLPRDFAALVSAVSDIAFVTDRSGTILDLIWNVETLDDVDRDALIGASMSSIVTPECYDKIAEMLRADGASETKRQREINHRIDGIDEFPVRYSTVGVGDSVIFLGQEIRAIASLQSRLVEAQRALDEDYSQLRQLETQYRVLFQTSSEALLVLDVASRKIEDCNVAATKVLRMDGAAIKGQRLESLFDADSVKTVLAGVQSVAATGQSDSFAGRLSVAQADVACRLSIFRAADAMRIQCTLVPDGLGATNGQAIESQLVGMVASIPDAVVLTDENGSIHWCNDAFLSMAEIALASQAEGENLARFLGRPGVDMNIILSNAREHGRLKAFSSLLTGAYGSETRVETSVAAITEPTPMVGFVMRDIGRYDQIPARMPEKGTETANNLMNLVGSVPLKELVRTSTEEIEEMCIEAALRKTGNNRASAAEMLGLSRQSLYVKLRRFNLLDRPGD
ncbi:MAG: transcriptional regulator PpsR [Pseudomonadota bacterium]